MIVFHSDPTFQLSGAFAMFLIFISQRMRSSCRELLPKKEEVSVTA
jgi:hypothetical protein